MPQRQVSYATVVNSPLLIVTEQTTVSRLRLENEAVNSLTEVWLCRQASSGGSGSLRM